MRYVSGDDATVADGFESVVFSGCRLGGDFGSVQFKDCVFEDCLFDDVRFRECGFENVDFGNSVMTDTSFYDCDFRVADFGRTSLLFGGNGVRSGNVEFDYCSGMGSVVGLGDCNMSTTVRFFECPPPRRADGLFSVDGFDHVEDVAGVEGLGKGGDFARVSTSEGPVGFRVGEFDGGSGFLDGEGRWPEDVGVCLLGRSSVRPPFLGVGEDGHCDGTRVLDMTVEDFVRSVNAVGVQDVPGMDVVFSDVASQPVELMTNHGLVIEANVSEHDGASWLESDRRYDVSWDACDRYPAGSKPMSGRDVAERSLAACHRRLDELRESFGLEPTHGTGVRRDAPARAVSMAPIASRPGTAVDERDVGDRGGLGE